MANFAYDHGMSEINHTDLDFETVLLKVLLLKSTHVEDQTDSFVSAVVADECDVTSYARQTLSTNTVAKDTTLHRTIFDSATNPTFAGLEAGNTIGSCVVFYDTTSDATAVLLFYIDTASGSPSFPFTTNGSDLTITWAATGIGYIQQ